MFPPLSLIAHRGDRAHAPENTLEAMDRAVAIGVDAIECDVHLSADGEVVVCHDATVDRTTDGSGAIASLRWAALRELDAGARWSPAQDPEQANGGITVGPRPFAGRGIRLPRLIDVLDRYPGLPLIIELKSLAVAAPTAALVHRCGAPSRVLIGSFVAAALSVARAAGLRTAASQGELVSRLPAALLGRRLGARPPFDALCIPPRWYGLPVPVAGFVRSLGVPVHVWTVNDPGQARRLRLAGAAGIITDDPTALRDLPPPALPSGPG